MTRFIQIHALTVYAPSNLNRDDTGRPKTAKFGGAERLRISSQALKRAIRTSHAFKTQLEGHLGIRTARTGEWFRAELIKLSVEPDKATAIAKALSAFVGKVDEEKSTDTSIRNKELFFMAPEERAHFASMIAEIARDPKLASELAATADAEDDEQTEADDEDAPKKKEKKKGKLSKEAKQKLKELREKVLVTVDTAADIAMFGRMVAKAPEFNREAAVQVAHAITTHKIEVEDDFYTAVDDLKKPSEDAGAGFIGELGFGSGVFYIYACIDSTLLEKNLGGDKALAATAVAALIEGLATASPTGKQASFASRARASYVRVEKGAQQPRQLSAAFLKPVSGNDLLTASVAELEKLAAAMSKAYGACFDSELTMNVAAGQCSLAELIAFATREA
ncbi:MAG: type I-E CRISPR-associated protein Cas7/Cse4/CasC [Hyphomicrobium sp.]|nr:MAG: type I-E CRISPR-associated protein Cas7/Cse4/CasC [Hyphomicrobium sp.]